MLNLNNNNNKNEKEEKVKVKLKRGAWEIEIECPESRLTDVISKVLAGLGTQTVPIVERSITSKGVTCKSLLEDLWKEGWFSEHRTLSEVDAELGRRGYHYDKSAISHTLTDLVREGILSREGSPRNYRYVQKRPPP